MTGRDDREFTTDATWWTQLDDGGTKRVSALKVGPLFHCQLEHYTAEQEAARQRVVSFRRVFATGDATSLLQDLRLVANAPMATFATQNAAEAYRFLGADAAARRAILAADPATPASCFEART